MVSPVVAKDAAQLEKELRKRLASGELTKDQYKAAHDRLERSDLVRRIQSGDDDFDESEQEKVRALKLEVKLRRLVASGELTPDQFKAARERFEQSNVVALGGEVAQEDADVEERDQKPVVDWSSPPDAHIAWVSRLYARPTYVLQTEQNSVDFWLKLDDPNPGLQLGAGGEIAKVFAGGLAEANGVTVTHSLVKVGRQRIVPDMPAAEVQALIEIRPVFLEFAGGRMETPKRIVFDRADAKLDDKGWPTEVATNGQQPKPYPCCGLDADELGMIGGVGMRLYFYLLSFLCCIFVLMAAVTTPSVLMMKDDNMYNHSEAARYRTVLAETTLGNVKAPIEELQSSGRLSHKLWKISAAEAIGSLAMLWMVLRASKQMARLVEKVDQASVTMSDYTVRVEPRKPWKSYQSVGKNKNLQLISDLKSALETTGQLAEINDEPCIWVAWNDRKNIALWNRKRDALIKLEAALFEAKTAGNPDAAEKAMDELDAVNKQLTDLNANTSWRPVCAYATFNLAEHYEDALRASEVEVGGVKCTITPAPEPESVKWEHLEFSATQRSCRKFIIYLGTALALVIGAGAILYANSLKVGTSYIDYCADVIGNASKDELASACPGVQLAGGVAWRPGAEADLAALYHNMFKVVYADFGDLFVAEEGDDGPESVGSPEESLPFAVCPDGERGTKGQPCHYIDTGLETTTEFLMARGDLDAMCYACICTLSSVDETIRTPLEEHLAGNPTYLDQCYATSAQTSFASASDAAATAIVDACAAVDLSDPTMAKDLCEAAGSCTYLKSDVQSYCEEMDEVVTYASICEW